MSKIAALLAKEKKIDFHSFAHLFTIFVNFAGDCVLCIVYCILLRIARFYVGVYYVRVFLSNSMNKIVNKFGFSITGNKFLTTLQNDEM